MGANVSTVLQETANETLVNILNTTMNSYVQNNKVSTDSVQRLIVKIKNSTFGGSLNIGQDAKIATATLAKLDANTINNINNDVINELTSKLTAKIEQLNKDLNLFQANVSHVQNIVRNALNVNLKNTIETTIEGDVEKYTRMLQEGTIEIDGSTISGGANIGQNAVIEQTTDQVMNIITENDSINKAINKILSDLDVDVSQLNKGIDPLSFIIAMLLPFILIPLGIFILGKMGVNMVPSTAGMNKSFIMLIVLSIISIALIISGGSKLAEQENLNTVSQDRMNQAIKQNEINRSLGGGLLGSGLFVLCIVIFIIYRMKRRR